MIKKLLLAILILFNLHSAQQRQDLESNMSQPEYDNAFKYFKNMYDQGMQTKDADAIAAAICNIDLLFKAINCPVGLHKFKNEDKSFEKAVNDKIREYFDKHQNIKTILEYEIIKPKKYKKKKSNLDLEVQRELNNALHHACAIGNLDSVKELFEQGADLQAKRKDGRTPLHTAVAHCRLDVFKFLVNEGVNVNSETEQGITALHIVAQSPKNIAENSEIAYILLHYSSNIVKLKCTKRNGWNAIHIAAAYGNVDILRQLVDAGIDHNMATKSKQPKTVLEIANEFNQEAIVNYLTLLNTKETKKIVKQKPKNKKILK